MKMPRQATFRSDNLDSSVKIKSTLQWIWEDIQKYVNSNPLQSSALIEIADTGALGVEFTVQHGLGRVPIGYIPTHINKPATIYVGATTWTVENIYLKASDNNVALGLLVF